MSDFLNRLSSVLKYSDTEYEKRAEILDEKFSSFSDLSKIDIRILSELSTEKDALFLKIISSLASRRIVDKFKMGRVYDEKDLFTFLRGFYYDIVNETVLILTIDSKNRIISADVIGDGTVNFSGILPRKLLEVMQQRSADRAILVHNHPGGKATASETDKETTEVVYRLLKSAKKELVCHYIVAGDDICRIDPIVVNS
jgi:DNA repair protein RadC